MNIGSRIRIVVQRRLVRLRPLSAVAALLVLLGLSLCVPPLYAAPSRIVHDMAGEEVVIPGQIERVATFGSVPVLNSLLFALGEGRRIANDLPDFAKKPRWGYQYVFAPQTRTLPMLQNIDRTPNFEAILLAAPDIGIAMDRLSAESLRRAGLPTLFIAWRHGEDVKKSVTFLGQILNRQDSAERYANRYDSIVSRVENTLHEHNPKRPRVLYFSPVTMSQPVLIAEWWIRVAGGESVTDDRRTSLARTFTMEQLLAWDPDILIVSDREGRDRVLQEPIFSSLKAVRSGRVLVVPCGAHGWGHYTSEQPLTALWAAKQFHPTLFANVDLVAETRRFYQDIFGVAVSAAQAQEILSGGPRGTQVSN